MSQDSNQHRIDGLRHQWQADPSSRLTLQLAEEYGRLGDYEAALEVLRTGLEQRPGHVASRVVLGRYLLAAGRPAEAREVLEEVATADQTHLVANKLLVESHLRLGQAREARDRLDLYTLLNESDGDIEGFEARLAALTAGSESSVAPVEPAAEEPAPLEPVPLEPVPEEPAPLEPAPEEPVVEPAAADSGTSVEVDLGDWLAEDPLGRPVPGAGFRGGVADTAPGGEEPLGAEVERPLADPQPGSAAEPLPASEPAQPAAPPAASPEARVSPEVTGELFPDVWEEAERDGHRRSADAESIFDLGPRVEPRFTPAADAEPAPDLFPAAKPAGEPVAAPVAQEVAESTVTLGRLYLEQGHRDEARRVFGEVLARDPGNRSARAGLAAAEAAGEWPLTAAELVSAETLAGGSGLECRRQLLNSYLARLKPSTARS